MRLNRIMYIANTVYPDDLIFSCFYDPDTDHGDGWAKQIVSELSETYDESATDTEQLVAASKALKTALRELQAVSDEFERRLYE
jgi:hypothetical protein